MKSKEYAQLKELLENSLLYNMPLVPAQSSTLYESMVYSLMAGGKRMRGVLCLAAADITGLGYSELIPFACAIEYIQAYSLIHDDLPALDNDDYRRGKLTNHKVFGEDMAILAGDGLLSAAMETMAEFCASCALNEGISRDRLNGILMAQACIANGVGIGGMVAGQVTDVQNAGKDIPGELLDYIHEHKTADFIRAAVLSGLFAGSADQKTIEDFTEYAQNMGIAFQIADDIADGDQTDECSYVTLHGMDEAKKRAAELLASARDSIKSYGAKALIYNDILDFLEEQI